MDRRRRRCIISAKSTLISVHPNGAIRTFLFCFVPKAVYGPKIFELFAKVFRIFRPHGNFFDGPKIFQILADSAAIRLVQKSSKSEPSSRFFSHLKFRKNLPVYVLPKFPRRIQNRNGHIFSMHNWGTLTCISPPVVA